MSVETTTYKFEDIREFLIRRSFLVDWFQGVYPVGHPDHHVKYKKSLVREYEYQGIKDRTLELSEERSFYLRAFIDGWKWAKS